MSTYGVHKLLKRIQRDAEFRERLRREPDVALGEFPLTDEECAALRGGEVGRLNRMGVHGYLLSQLARSGAFGITPERYMEQIHT